MTKKRATAHDNNFGQSRDRTSPTGGENTAHRRSNTGAFLEGFKGSFRLAGDLVKAVTEVGGQFVAPGSTKREH